MSSSLDYDIVIVGGGMSGLSAAEELSQAGLRVKLFEARSRLGGRVHTVTHEGGVLELGAQWLHGACHANPLVNLAARHGLLGPSLRVLEEGEDKHFYTRDGRIVREQVAEMAMRCYEAISDAIGCEKIGSDESLHDYYWRKVDELIDGQTTEEQKEDFLACMGGLELSMAEYACDDLRRVGAQVYSEGRELPGGDVIVPGGLCGIIKAIVDNIKDKSIISLNTSVENIDWGKEEEITVTTNTGRVTCHHVIVTTPLGVLQRHHGTMFTPGLGQEKVRAIMRMGAGKISKIFLEWNNPWWIQDHANLNLGWNQSELNAGRLDSGQWYNNISYFSEVEGQPNLLMFWVTGDAVEVADCLEDEEVMEAVTGLLRRVTGDLALPFPDRLIRHCWSTDPLTLGGYSYPGLQTQAQDYSLLMSPIPKEDKPRLLLAGEHTHPAHWSFLHGARLSGLEQARKVIHFIKSETEKDREKSR